MSRQPLALPSLAILLALASAAHGLVTHYKREEVGPVKGVRVPPGAGPESTFRLSRLRCYWRESGWDGWGISHHEVLAAFRGDVDEANAALLAFASLPAEDKVVRLFPGPGSRDASKKAIRAVGEAAGKSGVEEYWRQNRRLRAAIAEYCRSAAKQP